MISVLIVVSECYRPTFAGYHCPRRRRATPLRFDPLLAMRPPRRCHDPTFAEASVANTYSCGAVTRCCVVPTVSVAPAIVT